jgi:hypothetical protein
VGLGIRVEGLRLLLNFPGLMLRLKFSRFSVSDEGFCFLFVVDDVKLVIKNQVLNLIRRLHK